MGNEDARGEAIPMKRFQNSGGSKFGLEAIWAEGAKLNTITRWQMALQLGRLAWRSFAASPFTAFLTLLTTTVVLALFGSFVLLLHNVSSGVTGSSNDVSLRLFLFDDAQPQDIEKLRNDVAALPAIKSARLISKANALDEFRRALGDDASLLDGLEGENPLPASIDVVFAPAEDISERIDSFARQYRTHKLVQQLQYNRSLAGQLGELLHVVRVGGGFAVGIMLVVAAFVIAITIRLALYAHRQEILIMRLVGATAGFVRAPFLIEGAVEGLLGSCIALLVLGLMYRALRPALEDSDIASAFGAQLHFLPVGWVVLFLLLGPVLGFAGSFLAVRRFSEE